MKYLMSWVAIALAVGLLWAVASSSEAPSVKPTTRPEGKAMSPTEAVAAFYRVLVQDAPPTYEQEKGLFESLHSALRAHILDKTGAPSNQPVLMELYRKNRDMFLPKNMNDANSLAKRVALTSWFTFVGRPGHGASAVEYDKEQRSSGYVIACFIDDHKAAPAHIRSVVFSVTKDGKLGADDMCFGGFDGQTALERFFDQKWWLEHHGKDECP